MPAFLMAGGVAVLGSLIPFILVCVKQKSKGTHDRVEYLEELMDKQQDGMAKKGSKSDDFSKTSPLLESLSPVTVRNTTVRATHKRPVSFMWAMESPFFPVRNTTVRATHKRPVSFMWAMESPFNPSPP